MTEVVETAGVLTNDGDAPGMNAAIRVVVRVVINKGLKVKGTMCGYAGLLEEEIMDMESTSVSDTTNRGGTILYTVRCKEFTISEGQQKGVEICRKRGIDGMVVVGGGGSFRGAGKLPSLGISTIGLPGTVDLDIACTDYTISFDTAVNTVMGAIDKIRGTSISHERRSIVEVMRRNTGYTVLWYGTINGTEDILLPERYDGDERALINRITNNRRQGKKHNTIINVKGISHSGSMVEHIEVATDAETRTTTLGHIQRGGISTCKGRVYMSTVDAKAAELLIGGKSNRLVTYKHDEFVDYDIQETLNMSKDIPERQYEIAKMLARQFV